MSLSRVTTWSAGQVLTASALNGEFDNILSNALSLVSPLTAGLDVGGFDMENIDELEFDNAGGNASASGRLRRNSTNLTWHDGTAARRLAVKTTGEELIFTDATADASAAGYLTRNGVNLTWHNGTAAGRVFFAGGTDVPVADGGTGVSTVPSNGQLLIGNGTGYTVATLTDGTGISITEGAGTITIAAAGIIVFDTVTANTTVGNTTSEITLYTVSVPANTLSTNKRLHTRVLGKWSCTGSSPTLTCRVYYNSTIIAESVMQTSAVAQTDEMFVFETDLIADGATGAQLGYIKALADQASASNQINALGRGTAVEDSTQTLPLAIKVLWSAANASNTITLEYAQTVLYTA